MSTEPASGLLVGGLLTAIVGIIESRDQEIAPTGRFLLDVSLLKLPTSLVVTLQFDFRCNPGLLSSQSFQLIVPKL